MIDLKYAPFVVTENSEKADSYKEIPHHIDILINKIHNELTKGKESTLKKILKYCKRYPKIPQFRNYLSVWYKIRGNTTQEYASNKKTVEIFPDYLYGKISYATYLIDNKVDGLVSVFLDILGENLLLHELYPDRKIFYLDEVISYYLVTIQYLFYVEDDEEAEKRITFLEELAPEYHKLDMIRKIRVQRNFNRIISASKNSKKLMVSEKDNHSVFQTTDSPVFHFSKEMELLYNCSYEDIQEKDLDAILLLDKDLLLDDLLIALKDSYIRYEYYVDQEDREGYIEEKYAFPIHVLYLLGKLKNAKAVEPIFDFLRQKNDLLHFWFGFETSEFLPDVLENLEVTKQQCFRFLKEEQINGFQKIIVLERLFLFYQKQNISRDVVLKEQREFIQFLFENISNKNFVDGVFYTDYVYKLTKYRLKEFLPEIEKLFELKIINPMVNGSFESVSKEILTEINEKEHIIKPLSFENYYKRRVDFNYENQDFITDTVDKETILKNEVSKSENKKDIRRNDPCYCGSGKKYKKCCM